MMEDLKIKNAIIEGTNLDIGDRGLLTAWIYLDYGGTHQGFGGFALYLPESFKHHNDDVNYAGHFIYRVLQISDAKDWESLKGKSIRVKCSHNEVAEIGHFLKDDWFNPDKEFEQLKTQK